LKIIDERVGFQPSFLYIHSMIKELIRHLEAAKQIAEDNIEKADNFDLEDLSYNLESIIDELKEIGEFETYED
jgi:hypothetical protein